MKNLIINTLIAIVCFTSGYALYPTINDTEFEQTLTNDVKSENSTTKDIAVVSVPNVSQKSNINSDNSTLTEFPASNEEKSIELR